MKVSLFKEDLTDKSFIELTPREAKDLLKFLEDQLEGEANKKWFCRAYYDEYTQGSKPETKRGVVTIVIMKD